MQWYTLDSDIWSALCISFVILCVLCFIGRRKPSRPDDADL